MNATDKSFFKELYSKMQKSPRPEDWAMTLEITRSFINNQEGDYYQRHDATRLYLSHGYIEGGFKKELVDLPQPANDVESLSLIILQRYKIMEIDKASLPGKRFLYSYIQDVRSLFLLRFHKDLNLDEMLGTLIKKSQDYSQAFRSIGPEGIKARIWEKISRYISMAAQDVDPNYEPHEDSLKDLVGYLIILLALSLE